MMRQLFMMAMLVGVINPCVWAGEATDYFRAQADRATANLGDTVLYTVEVMVASAQQTTPDIVLPDLLGSFQVQDSITRSSINILNGRTYVVNFKELPLIANHTGVITIPPAKVQWLDPQSRQRVTKETNEVVIQINEASGVTALPTPTPEIGVLRPNKHFAHISLNQWLPILVGSVLIGAVIFGVWYWRHRPVPQPVAPSEPVDPRTPEQRALDALKDAERLKKEGRINELYTLLNMVVRRYLEEAFDFKAQEMTTRELFAEMERLDFKPEFIDRYRPYFNESDFVKFANLVPEKELLDSVDSRARQIILDPDKRIYREPPPPPEGETAPGEGEVPVAQYGEAVASVAPEKAGSGEPKPKSN
jgi:hypothetical protein